MLHKITAMIWHPYDFFSHTGADGSTVGDRVQNSGYQYSNAGENIAAGQTTAVDVVEGWINSPGHRANILNPNYTEIGVGYEYLQNDTGSINYNHYWTQVFGTPLNNNVGSKPKPQPDPVESVEEVETIDKVSNSEIEETTEPLTENTSDKGQSKSMEDMNNDVFNSDNSDSSNSYSYSISFKTSSSDSLTGKSFDLELTGGDSVANLMDDFGNMEKASWSIEQYKDNFSELLDDSRLGSSLNIQENSDLVDVVEYISNSNLAEGKKDLIFEMLDSFM